MSERKKLLRAITALKRRRDYLNLLVREGEANGYDKGERGALVLAIPILEKELFLCRETSTARGASTATS